MRRLAILPLALALGGCSRGCHDDVSPGAAPGASASAGAAVAHADSLTGGERGLDHVGIAVKDLDAATHVYHDVLGFSRPVPGRLPNGLQNVNYYFQDATYLETLVHWDRQKARWLADFTDHHTGALFAVVSAYSPEGTTAFLAGRGIHVGPPISGTIQTAGEDAAPGEKWKTLFLPSGTLPGDPLYFIAYSREAREQFLKQLDDPRERRQLHHKNTALGLRAVWMAVPDLERATAAYESVGFARKRDLTDPAIGASGRAMTAGEGEIWLLAPGASAGSTGAVDAFLKERGGPGIMGVTVAVGSLDVAAKVIGEGLGAVPPTYAGALGPSVRVGPEAALGAWVELSQAR